MLIREYRTAVPLTIEEYKIAQLHQTIEETKLEVKKGSPVKFLQNEPFQDVVLKKNTKYSGQYTKKIYYINHKIPKFWRRLLPRGPFKVDEDSWNAFPYVKTVLSTTTMFKGKFKMTIETVHYPDNGKQENIHGLDKDEWKKIDIVIIDIANDHLSRKEIKENWDPRKFKSTKTGRGPLTGNWMASVKPIVTSYKLVSIEFKFFGLQSHVEKYMHKVERKMLLKFHRKMFCSIDTWYGMTLQEVRRLEEESRKELEELCQDASKRYSKASRSLSKSQHSSHSSGSVPKEK